MAFKCAKGYGEDGEWVFGGAYVPDTHLVQGRENVASWLTDKRHCGTLVRVEVEASEYLPWRLLNLAANTITKHFGHTRDRINWGLNFKGKSYYKSFPGYEKITLEWEPTNLNWWFFVVAHEYGHALHNKALGGIWWRSPNCSPHYLDSISSYQCALKEGFADYAGTVGSGGYLEKCFEYFGTPKAPRRWCRDVSHERKPEIEGWVAALFMDLIDDNSNYEGFYDEAMDDKTHYSGYYVAGVFKSCEAKRGSWPDRWKHRSKVYDFVWCLEEFVDKPTHERVFPDTDVPDSAKHKRPPHRPKNWHWGDIRQTWLRNLAKEGR